MTDVSTTATRRRALIGTIALIAAAAFAIPAISAADRGHGHGHGHHSGEVVGTISSFDPDTGTLVIAVTGGDEVSATVTNRTKIECDDHGDQGDDDNGDDDNGDDGQGDDDNGDDGPNHDVGDDHGGSGQRRRSRDGHGHDGRGNCSMADLEVGAEVEKAELELTGDGLVYEEIELR